MKGNNIFSPPSLIGKDQIYYPVLNIAIDLYQIGIDKKIFP